MLFQRRAVQFDIERPQLGQQLVIGQWFGIRAKHLIRVLLAELRIHGALLLREAIYGYPREHAFSVSWQSVLQWTILGSFRPRQLPKEVLCRSYTPSPGPSSSTRKRLPIPVVIGRIAVRSARRRMS